MRISRIVLNHTPSLYRTFCSSSNSSNANIQAILHRFSSEKAMKRFSEEEGKSLLGRFSFEMPDPALSESSVVVSESNPFKKVLNPFFGVKIATISKTNFTGRWGIDHKIQEIRKNSKGETEIITKTKTVWHSTSGTLPSITYDLDSKNLRIYAGLAMPSYLIERAHQSFGIAKSLTPLDPEKIKDKTTVIEPFKLYKDTARSIALERLHELETDRAKASIKNSIVCDHVEITGLEYDFRALEFTEFLLPAYILQTKVLPPQILSGLSAKAKIIGIAHQSFTKLSILGAVAGFMFSACIAAPLPVQIPIVVGAILGGTWAQYGPLFINKFQKFVLDSERESNESNQESTEDQWRRKKTSQAASSTNKNGSHILAGYDKQLTILGIKPGIAVTENDIVKAWKEKLLKCHPDVNPKGGKMASEVNRAKTELIAAFKKL